MPLEGLKQGGEPVFATAHNSSSRQRFPHVVVFQHGVIALNQSGNESGAPGAGRIHSECSTLPFLLGAVYLLSFSGLTFNNITFSVRGGDGGSLEPTLSKQNPKKTKINQTTSIIIIGFLRGLFTSCIPLKICFPRVSSLGGVKKELKTYYSLYKLCSRPFTILFKTPSISVFHTSKEPRLLSRQRYSARRCSARA